MIQGFNPAEVAEEFGDEVTAALADFIEAETKQKANAASRRVRFIRSHGKTYNYARYQNTGQLAANTKQTGSGNRKIVNAGTRASYRGTGYDGMYFLVEKQGQKDVKAILKKAAKYASSLKL
jgi:hypothetical protein